MAAYLLYFTTQDENAIEALITPFDRNFVKLSRSLIVFQYEGEGLLGIIWARLGPLDHDAILLVEVAKVWGTPHPDPVIEAGLNRIFGPLRNR